MSAENLAVRTVRRYFDALAARDFAAAADTIAEHYRYEDCRPGLRTTTDKAGTVQMSRVVVDLGFVRADVDVIDARGDLTALTRLVYHGSQFSVSVLNLGEVDHEGRSVRTFIFDEEQLQEARERLDELSAPEPA